MVNSCVLLALATSMALLPLGAEAQRIRGRVLDQTTGDPIAGVVAALVGTSEAAATDLTGTFLLNAPRPGRYTLHLIRTGYGTVVTDTILLPDYETANIVFDMLPVAVKLEPVVVEARSRARLAGFYERVQAPGFGQFLLREEIDKRTGVVKTTDLLRTFAGIEVLPIRRGRAGASANMLTMRGPAGRCQPTVIIDGTRVKEFPESGLDDLLKPHMIEGVEIYTRGMSAPPQFGAQPGCGVLVFWTRSGSGEGAQKWPLKRILAAAGIAVAMVAVLALAQ